MTEAEWLACGEPARMVYYLAGGSEGLEGYRDLWQTSERKFRLFCCAATRHMLSRWVPRRQTVCDVVESVEQIVDGLTDRGIARQEFADAHSIYGPSGVFARACLRSCSASAAYDLCREPVDFQGEISCQFANAIRDIIGNPFRPASVRKVVTAARDMSAAALESGATEEVIWQSPWLTPQALALADAAYHERLPDGTLDPLRLAVLADALEEAGCDNSDGVCPECNGSGMRGTLGGKIGCYVCAPDYQTRGTGRSNRRLLRCRCGGAYAIVRKKSFPVPLSSCLKCRADGPPWEDVLRGEVIPHPTLAHLRSPGPHYRGCWAVDLILGKE